MIHMHFCKYVCRQDVYQIISMYVVCSLCEEVFFLVFNFLLNRSGDKVRRGDGMEERGDLYMHGSIAKCKSSNKLRLNNLIWTYHFHLCFFFYMLPRIIILSI
jgi:hypothetical protein